MFDSHASRNQTLPTAMSQPRWRLSVLDLLFLTTLAAIVLTLTHWLSRDLRPKQADLLPLAILYPIGATATINVVSYWIARSRGGRLLYWLRLKTTFIRWSVLTWIPIAAGVSLYLAGKLFGSNPDAAFVSTIMLWIFGTGSASNIVGGSLRFQEHGVVASPGLVWILSSWQRCRDARLPWEFDESGNLALGEGWSRVVAEVPPEQREAVDRVLKEKLEISSTPNP